MSETAPLKENCCKMTFTFVALAFSCVGCDTVTLQETKLPPTYITCRLFKINHACLETVLNIVVLVELLYLFLVMLLNSKIPAVMVNLTIRTSSTFYPFTIPSSTGTNQINKSDWEKSPSITCKELIIYTVGLW